MIRPEKLDLRLWKATLGKWGAVHTLLKRFDKNASSVLEPKTTGLVNHLVKSLPNFNAVTFLTKTLPTAGEQLSAKQYEETLELAARLADAGISPTHTLLLGVPALAQKCTVADSFSTNLVYLEALVTHMRNKGLDAGKPLMVAVRSATKELDTRQLTSSMVLATRLAENGVDPTDILRFGIPAAATALNSQQFRLALTLATHAGRRDADVAGTLQQLGVIAREVSPEQLTAGLRMAVHLEEKNVDLKGFFRAGLPAIVAVSATDEEFSRNLDLITALVLRLNEKGIDIDPPLNLMVSGCAETDDFRANVETMYRFSLQMKQHGIEPRLLLRHGLPPSVEQSPESFQSTLNNLATVVVRLRGAKINDNLFQYIIEFGLERVARSSTTADDYRARLLSLMKSFRQLALQDMELSSHHRALRSIRTNPDAFVFVTEGTSSDTLLCCGLALIYELAASAHFDWRRLDPSQVTALTEEAQDLVQSDKKFDIAYDPEHGPRLVEQTEGHAAFRSRARTGQLAKKEAT